jgi:hypothetical protein
LLDSVIAQTQEQQEQRRAEERAELAAKAEQEKDEKLSWFKGPDAPLAPPAYEDS